MNSRPILAILLLTNAATLLALGVVWKNRAPTSAPQTSPAPRATAASPAAAPKERKVVVTQTVTNAVAQKFDWRAVESDDYKKYIANLRSIGCPEKTIRDIIVADVNELFESRRKELAGPKKKFEFWKPGMMMGANIDPDRTEKERALNKEKRALLTDLLGSAPEEKPDLLAGMTSQLDAMFDFLPTEKRSKVMELMQDMQTKMQKAMKNGAPDPEDMGKVMKDMEAEIGRVLTPEELLDYNLRFSMTSNMMRMQLAGFEPSEQEFLDLFKKRKAFDDEYRGAFGGGLNLKGEELEKKKAAEKQLDDSMKTQLGQARYDDYKRAQDYTFQAMYRTADREGLGKEAAVKVYDMKKAAEDAATKIRNDRARSQEERTAALRSIREETERSVKGVFGEKGYSSYERNNGAYWLRGLSPDPAPVPTAKP